MIVGEFGEEEVKEEVKPAPPSSRPRTSGGGGRFSRGRKVKGEGDPQIDGRKPRPAPPTIHNNSTRPRPFSRGRGVKQQDGEQKQGTSVPTTEE